MGSECLEMDLTTTRQRDAVSQENGAKMRVAKSVFSIRSLVDLSENGERLEDRENGVQNGEFCLKLTRLIIASFIFYCPRIKLLRPEI